MFSSIEEARGDLEENLQGEVGRVLRAFSRAMWTKAIAAQIPVSAVPFVRPTNFLAALDTSSIHLVTDESSDGHIHHYIDWRQRPIAQGDRRVPDATQRELGFRSPAYVALPATWLELAEDALQSSVTAQAERLMVQVAEDLRATQVGLPVGYEHLRPLIPAFLADHPDLDKSVFLMMRFRSEAHYAQIHSILKDELGARGLKILRADDRAYTDDLWDNVCLYMAGCKYGVAVFEDIDEREFNPNVSLELGFMLALSKRCLLLKEQRMPRMPTDVVGKLYKVFNVLNLEPSLTQAVDEWIRDLGLSEVR